MRTSQQISTRGSIRYFKGRSRRLVYETLESRAMLSITVTTISDDPNQGHTLREAIDEAAGTTGNDVIDFDPTLSGTIVLNSPLSLGSGVRGNITIKGNGADVLTIDGTTAIFDVATPTYAYDLTISDLKLTGCTSSAIDKTGYYVNLTLEGVEVSENSSVFGAIRFGNGHLSIKDSTIANNTGLTGQLFINSGTVSLTNVTVSGNETFGAAAGIFSQNADVTLTNVTVTNNRAQKNGGSSGVGGIYAGTGTVTLVNTIVANNWVGTGSTHADILSSSSAISGSHSLIGFDSNQNNAINDDDEHGNIVGGEGSDPAINPALSALGNYGGTTRTHLLHANSRAVNAGDNSAVSGVSADQRGSDRIVGEFVDMGAVEIALVVSLAQDQVNGDFSANNLSLREALIAAELAPGADVIEFLPTLGSTIYLAGSFLTIDSDVVIQGPGVEELTIRPVEQTFNYRIFLVNPAIEVTIRDLTLAEGYAEHGPGAGDEPKYGGAILNKGQLTVQNVFFDHNYALWGGAAIAQITEGTSLTIVDCTFERSWLEPGQWGSGWWGTAVAANEGTVDIHSSTFTENPEYTTIEIRNDARLTMTNSTVSGNTGPGVKINNSEGADILNCTIVLNDTGLDIAAGEVNLVNSIVALNSQQNVSGTLNTNSHNLTGGDPLIGDLENNGGPTETHALLEGSDAIDGGDTDAVTGLDYDQRGEGFDRVDNDIVDIGAYEFGAGQSMAMLFGGGSAFQASLSQASQPANLSDVQTFDLATAPGPDRAAIVRRTYLSSTHGNSKPFSGAKIKMTSDASPWADQQDRAYDARGTPSRGRAELTDAYFESLASDA